MELGAGGILVISNQFPMNYKQFQRELQQIYSNSHLDSLLSPVPFFTSNPFPIPPIFLISYSNPILTLISSPILLSPVIFLSPLFCFRSPLLYCFCLTLHVLHATDNHVVLFPSCSRIMCWLNLMFIQSLLLLFSDICFRSGPWFPTFLYLNPLYLSIQPNLIISFTTYYFVFRISYFIYFIYLSIAHSLASTRSLLWTSVRPLSNFCPTPVSDLRPEIIGQTHISYEWVQHISWSQVLPVTLFQLFC